MPATNKERRATYRERKELGLCPRCGGKVRKNSRFTFCDDCREFFRDYNAETAENTSEIRRARYAERIENHQCPRCGKKLGKKYTKKICPECLEKQYSYNKN